MAKPELLPDPRPTQEEFVKIDSVDAHRWFRYPESRNSPLRRRQEFIILITRRLGFNIAMRRRSGFNFRGRTYIEPTRGEEMGDPSARHPPNSLWWRLNIALYPNYSASLSRSYPGEMGEAAGLRGVMMRQIDIERGRKVGAWSYLKTNKSNEEERDRRHHGAISKIDLGCSGNRMRE